LSQYSPVLSRSSEYAIRALAMLALQKDLKSLQAREIASELGLPPDFLTKILRRLTATDLVLSQRGRTGGFRLGRAPEEISLLDIVAPFEDHETGIQCLLGQAFCTDQQACPLHAEWVDIRVRFLDLLERTALADVAARAVRGPFLPHHDPAIAPAKGRTCVG
jgi:Rrf2 family protein